MLLAYPRRGWKMLPVFLTVDVEVWCDGWANLDAKFAKSFDAYVYGSTTRGNFGLPFQLSLLADHGLSAVFFVEPLFALRFGLEPLQEIVGLIMDARQEVQLHLHTEWVDEAREQILEPTPIKRQFLRDFSVGEQETLLREGCRLLRAAGVDRIDAFRAGGFGFDRNTLVALRRIGIQFDASYNATMWGPESGVSNGVLATEPFLCEGVLEYPMTVFDDGTGRLRHLQIGACSSGEIESLLWRAFEDGRSGVVLLSHNFELLSPSKSRPDNIVVARTRRLLDFLDRHRDCFETRGFRGLSASTQAVQPTPMRSTMWRTALRTAEQIARRAYR